MEATRRQQESFGLGEAVAGKLLVNAGCRMETSLCPIHDVYEIRPRKHRDGFDLISDRFRGGPIWYAGPDAVRYAVAYAKYRSHSRSHRAIIRVFDESGTAIQTHEFAGDVGDQGLTALRTYCEQLGRGFTRSVNRLRAAYGRGASRRSPADS
jgi:hypothetical protein